VHCPRIGCYGLSCPRISPSRCAARTLTYKADVQGALLQSCVLRYVVLFIAFSIIDPVRMSATDAQIALNIAPGACV